MTLDELNVQLDGQKFTPGWNKTSPSLWASPRTQYRPQHWRYSIAKEALNRAGGLISTDLAERRNLLMFDDADPGKYATTRTIVSAYQMLKPGEHARAHRHSPNALRLVLESEAGVATVVDGVELPIRPGEVLLTPGGTWHSHFNSGEANSYWIDFLDVPLVHQLEPMFFEPYPAEYQKSEHRPATHDFLIERGCIDNGLASASLGVDGIRMFDISRSAIPTLQLTVIDFSKDRGSLNVHETSNSVYAVMSGEGELLTETLSADWSFGDILSSPMWTRTSLRGRAGARLLRVSDRPVMEKLGFYRTAR